jgi:F-type H+-transporting ATPase subunit delta
MKTKKQLAREARRLFRLCFVEGSLDEARIRRVVQVVLQTNRRGGHILVTNFLRLVKLERYRHTAEVESATSLPPQLQAAVEGDLERLYGPGLNVSFAESPHLIGGMRIKVGSDVYDGSIKAGLEALRKSFSATAR